MKVKVETRTDLQLASGRRFTVKEPGEVDLDDLGYNREEQQEIAAKHWISKSGGKLPPAAPKPEEEPDGAGDGADPPADDAGDAAEES